MDLFSQLPEHLITHILYFLPAKEAARTSVLSKSWKSAWDSRSRVDIDLKVFRHKDLLQEFMVKTLERYVHQGLGVERLTISWDWGTFSRDHELALIKQWIDFAFAAGNKLKHLEVDPDSFRRDHFPLNLRASNTLTILTLHRCKFLNISENIKFPSLQNLSLRETPLTLDVFHKTFLSGSPFLESLYLFECEGLESLNVSGHGSPFLKSLSIYACRGLKSIEVSGLVRITEVTVAHCRSLRGVDVQAPSLRYFLFCGCKESGIPYKCQINLAACDGSLKILSLETFELPTDYNYWLQTMVSRFVSLKYLALVNLYSGKKEAIKISSPSLNQLNIGRCTSFDEGTVINAPNLCFVEFMDNKYPFYSLPKSNNLWRVQFSYSPLENQPVNALWLHTLKELFAKTNHLKGVTMAVQFGDKSILIFHKDFSHLLLCNIIHKLQDRTDLKLIFTIDKSSLSSKGMVERLFEPRWPLQEAIYIASSAGHKKFIKDFYEKVRGWRTTVRCCQHRRQKCWKHTLKDMEIESLNLERHINNINGGHNSINIEGLLQAYQALSYKMARINYSKPS